MKRSPGPRGRARHTGLLGLRAQEQVSEARERGPLLLEQLRDVAQRVNGGFQRRVLIVAQRALAGPIDEAVEIIHAQIDRGDRPRHLRPR